MTDESKQSAAGFDHTSFLKQLTQRPGIYQMIDSAGVVLYVGKAKNLKNRVSSYFRNRGLNNKTVALVSKIDHIEVTVTNSETEALLLEQNLIKQHRPHYNILLRDDKSYPYIYMSLDDEYPRLSFHRGAKRKKGRYFGPYPSAGAVRESLNFLQKVFQVRQCEDSVFKNRSRPCLQYQIKRCLGPCVSMHNPDAYHEAVRHTQLFLEGKSMVLKDELVSEMEAAAEALRFEEAALSRDQIAYLQQLQEKQYIEGETGDVDIIAASVTVGLACVQVLFVRGGRILGSRGFYPRLQLEDSPSEVIGAFLPQFYLSKTPTEIPKEIVVNTQPTDAALICDALGHYAGHKVLLSSRVKSHRAQWAKLAQRAAEQNLQSHIAGKQSMLKRFEDLQRALDLEELPQRLECFDISHSSGERTVASCVVFDVNGPLKSDYRRFNIEDITPGDDYAAMAQALLRRYTRVKNNESPVPDVLFIDGGRGQLSRALKVMEELALHDILLIGVAKGAARKPGLETLVLPEREFTLKPDSGALHLIQQVRDEAHRFAITGHRQRRAKARRTSSLEGIPGIGAGRRKALLSHFGGLQGVQRASIDDLRSVNGISRKLAEDIYASLHKS